MEEIIVVVRRSEVEMRYRIKLQSFIIMSIKHCVVIKSR